MDSWVWLVAYVVGFGLLQIALYRYFRRSDPTPETTAGRLNQGGASAPPSLGGDADAVEPCQHCGTVNESNRMVRYCRDCTEPLR